ncbi:MAG TPA: PilZ domain-containing protein [Blastocatellia bacterium]|nr:PilZ domain-containing protein [Blastocatellia bacterium]
MSRTDAAIQPTEVLPGEPESPGGKNRRRHPRSDLAIPVRVTGHELESGQWVEITHSFNVSRSGVGLRLCRKVRHGQVLCLMLPLPMHLRQHGHEETGYRAYALVRRVGPPQGGVRAVGLEFLGEQPPQRYADTPWAIFHAAEWKGTDRRRSARIHCSAPVWLQYLNGELEVIEQGGGWTENVSRGGARVCVESPALDFDLVRVTVVESGFESLAAVTNRYLKEDGLMRLCLQFIGREWPA